MYSFNIMNLHKLDIVVGEILYFYH